MGVLHVLMQQHLYLDGTPKPGEFLRQKLIDPVVIQPDGIQESGGYLNRTRGSVPAAGRKSNRLGDNSSQAGKVIKPRDLFGIPERSRCGQDRIRQGQRAESNRKVLLGHGQLSCRLASETVSSEPKRKRLPSPRVYPVSGEF